MNQETKTIKQYENKEFEPDIFDLEAWLQITNMAVYDIFKYNGNSEFYYPTLLKMWKDAGKPDIDSLIEETIFLGDAAK